MLPADSRQFLSLTAAIQKERLLDLCASYLNGYLPFQAIVFNPKCFNHRADGSGAVLTSHYSPMAASATVPV